MVSLADKHLGLPVAFVADDFDDEEDPVMYLLKECVKFVNHPHACEGTCQGLFCCPSLVHFSPSPLSRRDDIARELRKCEGNL